MGINNFDDDFRFEDQLPGETPIEYMDRIMRLDSDKHRVVSVACLKHITAIGQNPTQFVTEDKVDEETGLTLLKELVLPPGIRSWEVDQARVHIPAQVIHQASELLDEIHTALELEGKAFSNDHQELLDKMSRKNKRYEENRNRDAATTYEMVQQLGIGGYLLLGCISLSEISGEVIKNNDLIELAQGYFQNIPVIYQGLTQDIS